MCIRDRRWKRIEERTEDGFGNEESGEFWEGWIGVCVICQTEGRSEVGHQHWRECEVDEEERRGEESGGGEGVQKEVEVRVQRLAEEVEFEKYLGCWFCRMAQGICHFVILSI